ncbi:MAG: hypothetical protein IJQ90_04700 [Alphaproteobacteria bacterium]|nr:hypothetical protein [Alphaproteobacteria bacterium]
MLHLLSNIVCAFIPNKACRDKVRVMIRYPRRVREYVRFACTFGPNKQQCNVRTRVGYGCSNFIVILDDRYVFKFPLRGDGRDVSIREKRITDQIRKISPIKIPRMELWQCKNVVVRKYEFARGALLTEIEPKIIEKHRNHIAKQIAQFLYVIGKSNPADICDLKPRAKDRPGFMYGWNHGDIWQNFILNPKTFDITFFIDWECAYFGSFEPMLRAASHHWDKFGYRGIIVDVMAEYTKLYFQSGVKNK